MRRLARTLDSLAFLWACAATVYLLLSSSPGGVTASGLLAATGVGTGRVLPPLATARGVWMAGLLLVVTVLAGLPLGVAMTHPSGHRPTAWAVAGLLLAFCLLTTPFVGLLYLPSTLLLMVAGAVGVGPESSA